MTTEPLVLLANVELMDFLDSLVVKDRRANKVFLETMDFLELMDYLEKEETTVFPVSLDPPVFLEKTESVSQVWLDIQDLRENLENPDTLVPLELKDVLASLVNVDILELLDFLAEKELLEFLDRKENMVFLESLESKGEPVVLDWMESQDFLELKEKLDFPDCLAAPDLLENEDLMDCLVFL